MTDSLDRRNLPMVLLLDRDGRDDVGLLGGKAVNLVRLCRGGFRVPRACAVTTRAFDSILAAAGALARPLAPEAFDGFPLALEVMEGLQSFIRGGSANRFAVRSSAVAEDSATASFAGQMESFLNVKGDALDFYVRRCFASCFSARVEAYRHRIGAAVDASMAVIVQDMVEPDYAGVMFTADPLHPGDMAIEIVEGLGEALVSGDVMPSSYRVVRDGLKIWTDHEAVPIPADILRWLAATGLRVERLYGAPQDIEFAVTGQDIHLLQSRPITVGAHAVEA